MNDAVSKYGSHSIEGFYRYLSLCYVDVITTTGVPESDQQWIPPALLESVGRTQREMKLLARWIATKLEPTVEHDQPVRRRRTPHGSDC